MNDYTLADDEQQILDDMEHGALVPTADVPQRAQELAQYARATLNKTRNINIRLSERDIHRLKARAIEEGLPYQTLAASILHKSAART